MMSMMKLILYCRENGIPCTVYPITFESLISRARNAAVAHFMSDPTATHLIFIDADIEFDIKDVLKLIRADKDVVCGSYPQKWMDLSKYVPAATAAASAQPSFNPLHLCMTHSVHVITDAAATADDPTALLPVKYATTGFLLIRKGAIEKMIAAYPDRHYSNDIDGYMGAEPSKFYDLFPVAIEPTSRRYESEDYGFSRLWTSLGGEIHVIPDITLRHYGWYAYEGNLSHTLSARAR